MPQVTVPVVDLEGKKAGKVELSKIFDTPFRPDVIRKVVVALQSHRIQPQGRDPMAGKRTTAQSWGVGFATARVPRVKGSQYPAASSAAFVPSAVGGRSAYPPTIRKKIAKKINKKERMLAFKSAVAATAKRELVEARGHKLLADVNLPLVITDKVQGIETTKALEELLRSIGLSPDLERIRDRFQGQNPKRRRRGRQPKHGKGPLIVISEDKGLTKASRNLLGVDVIKVTDLNTEALAPGGKAARLTIWSASSIRELGRGE